MKSVSLAWRIALLDLLVTYRTSSLGPIWQTLTMGAQLFIIILVFSRLFQSDPSVYAAHVSIGFLVWTFLINTLSAAPSTLVSSRELIHQTKVPTFVWIIRPIFSNLFAFFHNCVVIVVILVVFPIKFSVGTWASVFGFSLVLWNVIWLSSLLATIGARWRDLDLVWRGSLTLLFYATPILWSLEQINSPTLNVIVNLNPLFHFIEVVRGPLVTGEVPVLSFTVAAMAAALGSAIAILLARAARPRLALWI